MVRLYLVFFLVTQLSATDLGVFSVLDTPESQTTSDSIDFVNQSEQKMKQLIIQESSPYIYNPIKEGLQGDKILLDVNGVRMTNNLFRSGPNQYFSWIPRAFVSSIEEDAPKKLMMNNSIGGEINQNLGINISKVSSKYNTNNNAFDLFSGYKSENYSAGISWIDTDNINDTKGEVPHSNYNQKSFYAQTKAVKYNEISFLLSQSKDIPRTDHYTNNDPYDYELQRYIHLSDALDLSSLGKMKISYQNFTENINADSTKIVTQNNIYGLTYGYNISQNISLSINNYFEDIHYNESKFTYNTFDAQMSYEENFSDFSFVMAYTFSNANIQGDLTNNFFNNSGLIKLAYSHFNISLTQGYRFPSIINLAKSIITEKGLDIANENLQPEQSTTLALAYNTKYIFSKLYYRILDNLITRELLSYQVNGLNAYQTINAQKGKMYGAILGSNLDFEKIKTSLYLEYTYGETQSDYISKITPFHATFMTQYKNYYAEFLYALKAKYMSISDQNDIRIVGHNNGYKITNIGYKYTQNKHQVQVNINNIFNTQGRVYASSVDWPSRNLNLEYTYHF